MKRTLFWISIFLLAIGGAAVLVFAQQAHYRHHGGALLPDPQVTSGKVRTTNLQEVCSETTKQFRKTTEKMKAQVYAAYGVDKTKPVRDGWQGPTPKPPLYEIDHLISLELGGADDVENLWPQPYYEKGFGAREKDEVENWLHKQVCEGKLDLAVAQAEIASDWFDLYLKMQKEKSEYLRIPYDDWKSSAMLAVKQRGASEH